MEWLSRTPLYGLYIYLRPEPPPPPRSSRYIPQEIILRIFLSIEDGECPGCSICRINTLYSCCLVSRAANEAATKLLYSSLDLSFSTAIRLDKIPANGHRSPALKRGISKNPELMVERGRTVGNGKPYITDCPRHYKLWKERDRKYSFGEHERTLALLCRTLSGKNPRIARAVKEVRLPEKCQLPWELGSDSGTVNPKAAKIGPRLVEILGLLGCLESIGNLGNLATFVNLVPAVEPLQALILATVAKNDCWRDWDWGEHRNPRQLHYLSHLGINSAKGFMTIHSNWKNLRHLSLGTVLLEECVGNSFPFAHLPSLRSLEVAGGRSLAAIFGAIPPNQLSSLSIQPGSYGGYASRPLISYLQRRNENDPVAAQRLTSLTLLAAVDDATDSLRNFRLDHFISSLLESAPQLQRLALALAPCRNVSPLLIPTSLPNPLERLYAPGAKLQNLKLVISAHDWSWLVHSLKASMFPVLKTVAITHAQHVNGLEEALAQQTGARFMEELGPVYVAAKEKRCRMMDQELVTIFAVKKVSEGGVMLRFIARSEEDGILAGGARGYI
ncbi:hypothetical protein Q9L58_004545 [Maublancomyces gigas]|uniref:F-box domain-containing protein n=1 Tax=Discina gigas TaxID=1032678 RepID=A0ABR3GKN2_9PEZI